ncbi:MAG: serine/threonine-protein kinase [Pirellulales bacterium]
MKTPADQPALRCPPNHELVALSVGKLEEERLVAVAHHVGQCSRCQEFLQAHNDASDSVVGLIRGETSGDATTAPVESAELSLLRHELKARDPGQGEPVETRPFPRQFGPYLLGDFIGQGGMGSVYLGQHVRLKRRVVIKFLAPQRLADAEAIARFHREMEMIGKFADPHVILAHDAGEADGHHYLVMEHVAGVDLRRLMLDGGPLPIAEACEVVRQAAAGLETAHRLEVVHRDVKPSNLLVSDSGQVKVLDLGLASLASGAGDRSGTADYMAPEQWRAEAVDARTDVYGLGCTLFKLLTGQAPFQAEGRDTFERMKAHLETAAPDVRSRRDDVPEGLALLLREMLAKTPGERTASMGAVAERLAPFAQGANLGELVRGRLARGISTESDVQGSTFAVRPTLLREAAGNRLRRLKRGEVVALGMLALIVLLGIVRSYREPLIVKDLLAAYPAPFLDHATFAERAKFDPDPQDEGGYIATSVQSAGWLTLKEPPEGPFTLHLELSQEEWFHHSGIFFGAVPSQEFPASWSHQAILLSPGAADDPERKLSLYWYTFESGMSEGHRSEGFAFESVPMPKPGTRHSLDLAIDQTGLTKVYWDGQELPKLVRDGNRHRPHYWPGGIGLLNGIGTTRFHRFWLLQGNERKLHGALNHQPDRSGDPLRLR